MTTHKKSVESGARSQPAKQKVATSGDKTKLVTTKTQVTTKPKVKKEKATATTPDQSPTATESPALVEAKKKCKVLVDYLESAGDAWGEMYAAEEMMKAAKEERKKDIASYVSPTAKVAPMVTVGYFRLGKALLRLEKLIAEGRLTRNLYRNWWEDQQRIPFAKHSRALDIATYFEKEEEVASMSLTQALREVKRRKAIELGNSPLAIDCANSLKSLTSRVKSANEKLSGLQPEVKESDIFAKKVTELASELAPLIQRLGIG